MSRVLSIVWASPGTHDAQIESLKTRMPDRAAELARQYDGERDGAGFRTSNVFLCYANEKLVGYVVQELHRAARRPVLIVDDAAMRSGFERELRSHFGASSDDADSSERAYRFERVTKTSDLSKLSKERAIDIKRGLADDFRVYRLFRGDKERGYMYAKNPPGEQPLLIIRLDFDVPHEETFRYLRAFRYDPQLGWTRPHRFAATREPARRTATHEPATDVERAKEIERRWSSVKSRNASLANAQQGETEDARTYAEVANDYDAEARELEAYRSKRGLRSVEEAREARQREWQREADAYYASVPGVTL